MRRLFRIWRLGAQDIRFLLSILRRSDRPHWLLPAMLLLLFFALEPVNFAIPALGIIDDFVLLPLLLRGLAAFAKTHRQGSRDYRVVSEQ